MSFLPYIPSHSHVIDIGCGNGRLIDLLQEKSCTYIGIDISKNLLDEARKKYPNHVFEEADMSFYHYGRERFHAAFCIASFHHIPSSIEQSKVLERIHAALKPQGYIFITVWNIWQQKYRKYIQKHPYHHSYISYNDGKKVLQRFYYAFTKTELVSLVKEAGFTIVDSWYSSKEQRVKRSEARNICVIAQKN